MKRNIYLNKLTLKEAKDKFNKALYKNKLNLPLNGELIFANDSLNRITAEPIFAKISSPYYQSAAMDGVVVRAKDTYGASESSPIKLKINHNFYFINTGNPIPRGFDAVIKVEDINIMDKIAFEEPVKSEEKEIKIFSAAFPGQHIRNIGEDIVANQLIVPVNHKICPLDIGGLLAGGINKLLVRKKPQIAIIPTGDELIEPGGEIVFGKVIEYNSKVIKGMISEWGGEALIYKIVKDIPGDLKNILQKAVKESDIVVVLAGSSAGSKDFTYEIIRSLGEILVHGVTIMPGKPTILGIIDCIPIIGLPGYPVSTVISAEQFLKPLVFKKLGLFLPKREMVKTKMAQKVVSRLGNEEFLRVKLGEVGGEMMAFPLSRGAGVITSLIDADGLIRIPSLKEGLDYREEAKAELLETLAKIKNNVIVTGSHDLILDVLKNELQENSSEFDIVSFNVGSLGGLMALKQNRTHLATSHLLDPESGEYNFPYIKKMLPQRELVVVNLTYREQGIMIKRGNPKNIKGVDDLVKKDIKFINRQKGSGTRVLLDYLLKKKEINPSNIQGYFREEFTHLMVASTVTEEGVDAGLGILSAAKAFDLDFIPIARERYDIIMPKEYYSDWRIQRLFNIVDSKNFKKRVIELGGYDLSQSGKVIKE
ncbi:MAG: molybdopterin biosynthesis protein [Candidatus Caldatribacteriota bacterium]|nr:molybdopterin biosynthesis protein [Candidatus Caldatribacteriota bacterium]